MKINLYIIGHEVYSPKDFSTLMLVKILLDGWAFRKLTIDVRKSANNIKLVNQLKGLTEV